MPNSYVEKHIVTTCECGPDGVMRADAWFSWYQNAAAVHASSLGCGHDGILPADMAWILLDVHAVWENHARAGDELALVTSVAQSIHWLYPRVFESRLADGRIAARATTTWALLDTAARRITRHPNIQALHDGAAGGPAERVPPFEPLDAPCVERAFSTAAEDFDENGHVNNARYIAWACAALAEQNARINTVSARYQREILPGEPLRSLAVDGGRFAYEIFSGEKRCFAASGSYEEII